MLILLVPCKGLRCALPPSLCDRKWKWLLPMLEIYVDYSTKFKGVCVYVYEREGGMEKGRERNGFFLNNSLSNQLVDRPATDLNLAI